jgi:hypothetical protein
VERIRGDVGATGSTIGLRDALLWAGASLFVPAIVVLALELPGTAIERIAAPMLGQLSTAVRLPAPSADPQGSQSLGGRPPVSGSRGFASETSKATGADVVAGTVEPSSFDPLLDDPFPESPVLEPVENPASPEAPGGEPGPADPAPPTPPAGDAPRDPGGPTEPSSGPTGGDVDQPGGDGFAPFPTDDETGSSEEDTDTSGPGSEGTS